MNRCKRKFQEAFGTIDSDISKSTTDNNNNNAINSSTQTQPRLPTTTDFISL